MTYEDHRFGPELGYKPTTYTCRCGFRSTDYGEVGRHITDENALLHKPRHLTTVPSANGALTIEIAATPYGDARDAVEIRAVVRESESTYRTHMMWVPRNQLAFLIDSLESHRLGSPTEPCAACAGHAFAARLTDAAMQTPHTCGTAPPEETS